MAHSVRLLLILAVPAVLCCGSPASAQLDYVPEVNDMSTAPIGATSPLGIDSSSIGGTGIPLGATEIKSAGLSPLATYSTGTIALPGSGTTCATSGMSQPGGAGSADTYDGGGMAMTSAATATVGSAAASSSTTGMSVTNVAPTDPGTLPISGISTTYAAGTVGVTGTCSAGSSGLASPSSPASTAPTTPGGNPRVGIPLGSSEIANLGVGSWATLPTPLVSPFATAASTTLPPVPTMPVVTTPLSTPATTAPASLAASITSINGASGLQSSVSGIPILVPGLAGR
jgi:hypothetical protein